MLSDAIDFFTRIALKAKVIEAEFDFVLDNHQDEERIFTFFSCGSEPDVVPAFAAAIANHREPAEVCVEVDRTGEVAAIDRDVGPAWHVSAVGAPTSCRRVASILARTWFGNMPAGCRRTPPKNA